MRIRKWLCLVTFFLVSPFIRGQADSTGTLPRGLRPSAFAITNAKIIHRQARKLPRARFLSVMGVSKLLERMWLCRPMRLSSTRLENAFIRPNRLPKLMGNRPGPAPDRGRCASSGRLASEALIATKPDNRKGVFPEFIAATALKSDDSADSWRKIGITARLAAPTGGILAGQSSVVSLNGVSARDSLIRTPFALHLAFRISGAGDYPRAQMARWHMPGSFSSMLNITDGYPRRAQPSPLIRHWKPQSVIRWHASGGF